MIVRRYVEGQFGQVHLRESGVASGTVPLVCLHATAYSSRSFEALMRAVGCDRHIIAIDLPGYGESEAPTGDLDIAGYAEVVTETIVATVGKQPVTLFGYHTGVVIAAEVALRRLVPVLGLTFLGVPYFEALDFAAWKRKLACQHQLGEQLEQFAERWNYLVANRPSGLSLRRGFENFVDELKAWPDGSNAHQALFAYDLRARFALLDCPVTILNPQGHLAEPSRAVAAFVSGARLIELPELHGAVLDTGAARIAGLIPSGAEFLPRQNTAEKRVVGRPIPAG